MGLDRALTIGRRLALAAWLGASIALAIPLTPVRAEGVTATRVAIDGDSAKTRFAVTLSDGVTAEIFTLANPYRVVVDLPDVAFQLPSEAADHKKGLISEYRYGLFAERKARIVIETTGPVRIALAKMDRIANSKSIVLSINLEPTDAVAFGEGTGSTRSAEKPAAAVAPRPKPQAKKKHEKPTILIDPGHGGIDPGAMGANNVPEKTLVLAVGARVAEALRQTGRYKVEMTRTTDVFVSLDKRLAKSEELDADLFLSLHADAIEQRNVAEAIRGATVYTLSERASDEQARLMAEKENASDLIAGLERNDTPEGDQVRNILIDLLKRETANFSADFSNVLTNKLKQTIAMSRDPQRSAAFKVLKQPHAPSVLVELGYMSNSEDQRQMGTAAWQDKVAKAIAASIDTYFNKRLAEHP